MEWKVTKLPDDPQLSPEATRRRRTTHYHMKDVEKEGSLKKEQRETREIYDPRTKKKSA
jgi:hypothetical protein